MHFRLLGPLEVSNGDDPVRIGAGRQREVLVALLLHRNEVVSNERMIDALWGERSPATASKVVQNTVGQLRRALDDRSGQRLQTRGHGYVLRVASGELDIDRFEALVKDGGRALADGRPAEAADRVRKALVLWRGPPLEDVAYETFAQPEIARLEELFAVALERRIDAELALGADADLVPELEALVARHPLRERLRAQLMLALYRCGRQAEALAAFREARRVLIEEVGVEPGGDLRALHEAILRQEPGLELERPALPSALDASRAPPLVGRDGEMRWLREQWQRACAGASTLVAVTGQTGVGKTRLASELAGEVFRSGALVLDASAPEAASALAQAIGGVGAGRPWLLVFDDVQADRRAWPRRDALPPGRGLLLVTAETAEQLTGLSVDATLPLGPLDGDAVAAIASAYAPESAAEAVPADELLQVSGGLPRRVHEAASAWAAREAARRVVDMAPRAAAGRSHLRHIEAGLAGRLFELQEARQRLGRFDDDDANVICPFKGLASFEFDDAPYFSGRERLIAETIAHAVGAPLLGLLGPSGSGKSSLVKAGLLPALASGVLPGSAAWPRAVIRPGEHPMRELGRVLPGAGVLAVDQFEELFTACRDESERLAFVEALVGAARHRDGEGLIVAALRADYYGRCAAYPQLSKLLGANHVLVGPMTAHELRRAIERPAVRAGLEVDPELVDAIVSDVDGEPGALPLMSSALLELWQRRDHRRLRYDIYVATGGVRGAVARLAEAAFAELDPGQQGIARQALVRLATDGPQGEVVRRRVQLADLQAEDEGQVRAVLQLLADRRLLTLSASSVEVAHEALLREWPRLRGWLEADAQSRRVQGHLAQAATDWHDRGRDPADLYRGARLAIAGEWRDTHEDRLKPIERAFLDAGRTAAERQHRRLRLALAGVAALLALAIVGGIVAVRQRTVARQQAQTAAAQRVSQQALTEPNLDRSLLLAREGVALADSPFTRGNLLRALSRDPAAIAVVRGEGNAVRALDISPDGRTLVVGDSQGSVDLIDLVTRRVIRRRAVGGPVTAVRLSPDGSRLAVTSLDYIATGVLKLLYARTLTDVQPHETTVELPYVDVADPAFSPDSRVLAADVGQEVTGTRFRRTVMRWDARTARPLGRPHPVTSLLPNNSRVSSVPVLGGYVDDGARLVTSSDHDDLTVIRDRRDLRTIHRLAGGGYPAAVSADGRLAALTARRGVRLLDLRAGQVRALSGRASGPVTAVRFTPDSHSLIAAGRDRTITVWDARRATATRTIGPLAGSVRALAISRDGRTAYGGDEHGSVIAWDLTGRRGLGRPFHLPGQRPAAIAPAAARSHLLAIADAAGLELLDTRTLDPVHRIPLRGGADAVTVAPDGRTAAFGTHDGSVGFADLLAVRLLRPAEASHVHAVRDLAFSRDGRHLATTDGTVVFLWDALAKRPIAAFQGVAGLATSIRFAASGRTLVVSAARQDGSGVLDYLAVPHLRLVRQAVVTPLRQTAFSRDGKILFSADRAGRLWLLDARTSHPLGAALAANASQFALDPKDRLLATSSPAGTVQLWDIASGRPLGDTLPGISGGATRVAFVASGAALVTLQNDGRGIVWDMRPQSWARRACAVAGRTLTVHEWRDVLPQTSYSPACAAHR